MDRVCQRMQTQPLESAIKKQLLGIFMSALSYNANATVMYLEQKQMTYNLV